MQKGINLASRDFKNNVIGLINDSSLPPILIKYILNDLVNETNIATEDMIQMEYKKFQEDLEQEEKKRLAQNKSNYKKKNGKGEKRNAKIYKKLKTF